MANKEKTLIKAGEVKILDARIVKEGVAATGRPWAKCKVTIETKNGPLELTAWSKSCLTLIGKTARAKIFSTQSAFGEDKEIEFEKTYGTPAPSTVDLSEINKKLDRILKYLEGKETVIESTPVTAEEELPTITEDDEPFDHTF
jgi:hypothetical protein